MVLNLMIQLSLELKILP